MEGFIKEKRLNLKVPKMPEVDEKYSVFSVEYPTSNKQQRATGFR